MLPRNMQLIFIGEHHSQTGVVEAQASVVRSAAEELLAQPKAGVQGLHIVFEHFSVAQTSLVQSFVEGKLPFSEFWDRYQSSGQEGFPLPTYRRALEAVQEAARDARLAVRGFGGFIPRPRARDFVGLAPQLIDDINTDTSKSTPLQRAVADGTLLPASLCIALNHLPVVPGLVESCTSVEVACAATTSTGLSACTAASSAHRSFFFSLLSGEDLPRTAEAAREAFSDTATDASAGRDGSASPLQSTPSGGRGPLHPDNPSRILPAQVIKDMVAACVVHRALAELPPAGGTVIVMCGKGHSDYGFGIPERVLALLAACPVTAAATPALGASDAVDAAATTGSSTHTPDAAACSNATCAPTGNAEGGAGTGCLGDGTPEDDHHDDSGGHLLIMSCCDEREAEHAGKPAFFPDGTSRRIAHAIILYTPDPDDDDE